MPQLIQRPPLGLLGLLDSKAGGMNPNALLDEVRGSVELRELYGVQTRFSVNSAIAAGAIVAGLNVFAPTLTAPGSGALWLMRAIGVRCTAAYAAATFRFNVGVFDLRNNSYIALTDTVGGAIGEQPSVGTRMDGYVWRPGDQLAMWAVNAAGAVNVTGTVAFDLLAI